MGHSTQDTKHTTVTEIIMNERYKKQMQQLELASVLRRLNYYEKIIVLVRAWWILWKQKIYSK